MDDERLRQLEDARRRLRERFAGRIQATPGRSDPRPQGTGPANRHGMPQLPPGQRVVKRWPVLDLGIQPRLDTAGWRLTVDGAVEAPLSLSWEDLLDLPQVEEAQDFHCADGWSCLGLRFGGVRLETVLALASPRADASHVRFHAHDGYTTNLPLEEALKEDVLLAHTFDGAPLPAEHGGPCRVVVPELYAWKGAKWIARVEVTTRNVKGHWEQSGYSDTAHPWRDDRFSAG